MKKTYISPEVNVVKLNPTLMAGVNLTVSSTGDDMPDVSDDDIPEGVTGNSRGWVIGFTEE